MRVYASRVLSALAFLLTSFFAVGQQCNSQAVSLQVLGSGGPELDDGRASTGYLVWIQNKARFIVDTGPGSSVIFGQSGANFSDLKGILFTHFHADHSGDFPAFIKGSYFTDRQADLPVFGPDKGWKMPSTSMFVKLLFEEQGAYGYLHDYLDASDGDYSLVAHDVPLKQKQITRYEIDTQTHISAIPVHHGPVPAIAWRVDIGACSLAFSGDMSNRYGVFADFAKGADILVMHNAVPEHAGEIARNLHMTPSEIGKIAKQAKAGQVLLSHFMKRTENTAATLEQIGKYYQGRVTLAADGKTYSL